MNNLTRFLRGFSNEVEEEVGYRLVKPTCAQDFCLVSCVSVGLSLSSLDGCERLPRPFCHANARMETASGPK